VVEASADLPPLRGVRRWLSLPAPWRLRTWFSPSAPRRRSGAVPAAGGPPAAGPWCCAELRAGACASCSASSLGSAASSLVAPRSLLPGSSWCSSSLCPAARVPPPAQEQRAARPPARPPLPPGGPPARCPAHRPAPRCARPPGTPPSPPGGPSGGVASLNLSRSQNLGCCNAAKCQSAKSQLPPGNIPLGETDVTTIKNDAEILLV
jgi:hypothetical protein